MPNKPTSRDSRTKALQSLQSLERSGLDFLPKPGRRPVAARASAPPELKTEEPAQTDPVARQAPVDVSQALAVLQKQVAACTACDELASTRTQTVFGVGNPQARLCFLGEAPGADEDAKGEPFVGRAGQLLTKIIEACTLSRGEVYILNVLKCRPPGNRNPAPDEVRNCRGFLNAQLDLIRPEYVCCLGTIAAQTLLETDTPIGRMRGKFFDYRGIKVMCTYHPAYLLRNPAAKKDVWDDMKILLKEMGIAVPR